MSIFSIIERVSRKRLTEVALYLLLIIDACRDTLSINKHFSKDMQVIIENMVKPPTHHVPTGRLSKQTMNI